MCPHNNPEYRSKDLDNSEIEKSKIFTNIDLIGYEPNSIVCRTIVKKPAGNISILSFNTDKEVKEKTSPFDTFIQIIDGKAEIIIDGTSNFLEAGQSIIIPAHASNFVKATERFKMVSTTIKSGYE
ncbi:MAG: cupin domain-containing protein [Bacteroidales bacterium]|nr:cupin domain-containing protein [Bacteroidales bacterium]